ncbi:MAG: hypothetical protein VB957_08790 [Pseudomonadales bacterium]|jgi:hypothetical protein
MNRTLTIRSIIALLATCLIQITSAQADTEHKMSIGNGDKNWIITDGASRIDKTLTFKEVSIDGNGWLVMHPFEGGKPNGDKYVAYTYLENGMNKDVEIKVHKGVDTGEMFIVMLHRDLNENKILDFIFVDDTNVMDKAVFEGHTMIVHAIPAP